MPYDETKLNELSEKLGILLSFTDFGTGMVYTADSKSKRAICTAMGYPAQTNKAVLKSLEKYEKEQWLCQTAPTDVVYDTQISPFIFEMSLPKAYEQDKILFQLKREDGTYFDGYFFFKDMPLISEKNIDETIYQKRRIYLFIEVSLGYHSMHFQLRDGTCFDKYLIVVPKQCYQPAFVQEGKHIYGFPLQLYALRSQKNWGIGDFSDLKSFIPIAEKVGADVIGVNPLNVLFADTPEDASPYCASSRLFLNPLYADITAISEIQDLKESERIGMTEYIQSLQNNLQVQYTAVSSLKEVYFEKLYRIFCEKNFDETGQPITKRGTDFISFCHEKGNNLLSFAVFQLLRSDFIKQEKTALWWKWDKEYQDINSSTIQAYIHTHRHEIDLIRYQQFVINEQYDDLIQHFKKSKLSVGLYTDLPVGVCANSAEVWSNQNVFMQGVTTGAPPDVFNRNGQDWSLAPFNPYCLEQTGYKAYIDVIRQAMKGAGAVRIDHAFGLERLYLRVKKATGAYLKYNFKAFMGIVALESVRNQCLVVAEDLGTAPLGFTEKMGQAKTLSFKILHYQRAGDRLIEPQHYPYHSLIATGTHDLPSYSAFWKGLDLELGLQQKTITQAQYRMHRKNRKSDKELFVKTFQSKNYPMPDNLGTIKSADTSVPEWFIPNVYRFLSETNSQLLLVRLEDILGQDEQINLPGTYLEYPNWRYKLPILIEDLIHDKRFNQICDIVMQNRKKG